MKKIFVFVCLAMAVLILLTAMSGPFKDTKVDSDKTTDKVITTEPAQTFEEGVFYYTTADFTNLHSNYDSTDDISAIPPGVRGFMVLDGITYFGAYCDVACDASELVCEIYQSEYYGDNFREIVLGSDMATDEYDGYTFTWNYTEDLTSVGNDLYHNTSGPSIAFYYLVVDCTDPIVVHQDLLEKFYVGAEMFDPGVSEGPSAE